MASSSWDHAVRQLRAFVGAVLKKPTPRVLTPSERLRRKRLPFELFLASGTQSIRLFPTGPIDPLAFFQRFHVANHHELEFLTSLDPYDALSEDFHGFGLFKLRARESYPLPRPGEADAFFNGLARKHGLVSLPKARTLIRSRTRGGLNCPRPPNSGRIYQTVGRRRFTYSDALAILRSELTGPQAIAWIEEAFVETPSHGQIIHRYYLDRERQAYLVRHHWRDGKTLYMAETSEEALRLCELASGAFRRADDSEERQRRAA